MKNTGNTLVWRVLHRNFFYISSSKCKKIADGWVYVDLYRGDNDKSIMGRLRNSRVRIFLLIQWEFKANGFLGDLHWRYGFIFSEDEKLKIVCFSQHNSILIKISKSQVNLLLSGGGGGIFNRGKKKKCAKIKFLSNFWVEMWRKAE